MRLRARTSLRSSINERCHGAKRRWREPETPETPEAGPVLDQCRGRTVHLKALQTTLLKERVAIAGWAPESQISRGKEFSSPEAKTLRSEMTAFPAAMEADSVQFYRSGQTECLNQC